MSLEVVGSESSFAHQASYLATSSQSGRSPQAADEPTELSNGDHENTSNEPGAWRIPAYYPRGVTSKHQAAANRTKAAAKVEEKGLKIVPKLVCKSTRQESEDSYPASAGNVPIEYPAGQAGEPVMYWCYVAPPSPQNAPNLQAAGAPKMEITRTVATDVPATKRRISPALWIPESCAADTLRRFGDGSPSSSGTHPETTRTDTIESPGPSPKKPNGRNKLRTMPVEEEYYWCAVWYHTQERKWMACVPDHATATPAAHRSRQVAINTAEQLLASQVCIDRPVYRWKAQRKEDSKYLVYSLPIPWPKP